MVFGRGEFLLDNGLHMDNGCHQGVQQDETFSVLLANLSAVPVTHGKGTHVGVAERIKDVDCRLTPQILLTVKQ